VGCVNCLFVPLRSALSATSEDLSASSPWRRPSFRWFFFGQFVSLLGSAMSPVALAFAVLNASGGNSKDLALVLAAQTVPILALPLGGAVADRFPRSRVLVFSHIGAALGQGILAILLLSGRYQLGAVMVLAALNGLSMSFTTPALRGIMPQLVEKSALQRANSAQATARNISRVIGPTVGGMLVVTVGGGWAIAIDAVTYLVAAVCMTRLRLPSTALTGVRTSLFRELRDGWSAFRSLNWVVVIVSAFFGANFILAGVWLVLGPSIARETIGEAAWGVVLSARAVGLLIMGLVMYKLTITRLLPVGQACAVLAAVPFILLGFDLPAIWLIGAAFVAGLGVAVEGIAWETSLQEHAAPEVLSRVGSYDQFGSWISVPLGQLAIIPIAAAFGDRHVAIIGGVIFGALTLVPLAFPSVRNLRHAV
jgi:MFS family permease